MYYISSSKIHGKGIFIDRDLESEKPIGIGIDFKYFFLPYVTSDFGSYINHSSNPNTKLEYIDNKYYVVSKKYIKKDTEITLNYRNTPWYISKPDPNWK